MEAAALSAWMAWSTAALGEVERAALGVRRRARAACLAARARARVSARAHGGGLERRRVAAVVWNGGGTVWSEGGEWMYGSGGSKQE